MSPDLRGKVMTFSFSKWLSVIPFFKLSITGLSASMAGNVEAEFFAFMNALAPLVQQIAFPPLEAILRPKQVGQAMYGTTVLCPLLYFSLYRFSGVVPTYSLLLEHAVVPVLQLVCAVWTATMIVYVFGMCSALKCRNGLWYCLDALVL